MLIGIDFDNTIVSYDQAFHRAAFEKQLIPAEVPAVKNQVRDYLRKHDQEEEWIELQGLVYGHLILESLPFPGFLDFLAQCGEREIDVCIISHRTRTAARGVPYDLHKAAQSWLDHQGISTKSGSSKYVQNAYFEITKGAKLERVGLVGCKYFIDDLPEFVNAPNFPSQVQPILFDPEHKFDLGDHIWKSESWNQISELIFGEEIS